ncbi:Na(+)/H(+) antiporter [Lactiplantibacillus plantarum]|nr:Na(+)/H(+) antiporter [Lactiplantibacillus plantarum]
MDFLGILCLLILATTLAGHFAHRAGIPAVIGEILVGVILGPALFNWVHLTTLVQTFSDIGGRGTDVHRWTGKQLSTFT